MPICILCSTISLIFAAVVLVTSSTSNVVLQTLNWATSDIYSVGSVSVTYYLNIYEYGEDVTFNDDSINSYRYDSSNCDYSFCNDCDTGNKVVLAFAVLFFVLCLPGMYTNIVRTGNSNTSLNKNIGIFSASAACVCGAISLIVFTSKCLKKVEDNNTNIDWNYGAAYGLLSAAMSLKFVDCLFNCIINTDTAAEGLLDRLQ